MSADYDRLFHSSGDAVQTADEESERGAATPIPTGGLGRSEVTPPPMPIAPTETQAAPASPLLQTVVAKLHRMLRPGASLFALFNTEERIESISTYAYRIQDHRTIQMSARAQRKPAQIFNNRSLEKLFQDFSSVKFFLTRDRLREVIVKR